MSTGGPLRGLRVIEVAGIGPGPLAAMLLADLGAEVVRVERTRPEPGLLALEPRHQVALRGRRSVALDLKHAQGLAALLRLVETADVLIEPFRPGVAERLGFGPEDCLARNPRLVYGRITGFGQDGPLAQAAGHDLNYIALTGALHAIGPAGGKPVPPLNLLGDYGGGTMFLAFGIACALLERVRSGQGQVVDAAMVDGAALLMAPTYGMLAAGAWRDARGSNLLDGHAPFYDTYETADGRHLAVAALEPRFFAELAARLGLDPRFVRGQYDRALWPDLRAALTALFRTRSRDAWCALLEGTDACVTAVASMAEAPRHPHTAARGTFMALADVVQPAPAPRFSRSVPPAPAPPGPPGAETDSVLAEAGFTAGEIAAMRAAGAIG